MIQWQQPEAIPPLYQDEVHLWELDMSAPGLEGPALEAQVETCFHAQERERLARFTAEEAARQYLCGRVLLKQLLSVYLGQPGAAIRLQYTTRGKPFVENAEIQFNISHSRDRVCIGISRQRMLGVDIEWINPQRDMRPVARRYFSPQEQEALEVSEDWAATFFSTWTRKEAYLKAIGHGISIKLSDIDTTGDGLEGWGLTSFRIDDFQGALAVEPGDAVVIRAWSATEWLREAF